MRRYIMLSVALLGGVLFASLSQNRTEAEVTKGNSRAAATKYLMKGILVANCGPLGKMLKAGISDEKAWDTAACHAACMNEMAHILMADGRCPDGVWAGTAPPTLAFVCGCALLCGAAVILMQSVLLVDVMRLPHSRLAF